MSERFTNVDALLTRTFFFLLLLTLVACSPLPAKCPPDCVGAKLRTADLTGMKLSKANLSQADLRDARLAEADLSGANLSGANLSGASLVKADLSGAKLVGVNLKGANLTEAILKGVNLSGANLSEAILTKVNLTTDVTLTAVILTQARLIGSDLSGASLAGANLQEANLQAANLSGASLIGTELIGANLSGADLQKSDLRGANLSGANLIGVDLELANLGGATLGKESAGAILWGAQLRGANLEGAILNGADFSGANLSKTNLVKANLLNALLKGTNLEGADLRQATLTTGQGTYDSDRSLAKADLSGIKYNLRTKWPVGFYPPPSSTFKQGAPFSGLKIALLLSDAKDASAWNKLGVQGVEALEEAGAKVAISDKVADERQFLVIGEYAAQGYDIIIGHGFQYADALSKAAEEYPDIKFIQIGGTASNGQNLASYEFKRGEAGYAVGILAGQMWLSGRIASLGGVNIPRLEANFNAFEQAVKEVSPAIGDVAVTYVGSWNNISRGKEAAETLINRGVKLMLTDGDSAIQGAIQARQNRELYLIGWTADRTELAPDVVLTSVEQRIDNIMFGAVSAIGDGTIEWSNHPVGFAEDAQTLAPFHEDVPSRVSDEVEAVIQAIIEGKIVFDEAGNVVKDEYHR